MGPAVSKKKAVQNVKRTSLIPDSKPSTSIRIILIGPLGVGKSSLLYRFIESNWSPSHISTWNDLDDGYDGSKTVTINNRDITVNIRDTHGTEAFHSQTASDIADADGIMIVYDIASKQRVAEVTDCLERTNRFGKQGTVKMVVGNKSDLSIGRSKVDISEIENISKFSNLHFFPNGISAKNNINIDTAFNSLVAEIVFGERSFHDRYAS